MRQGLNSNLENRYVNHIDAKTDSKKSWEARMGQGKPAEQFIAMFYGGLPGFQGREATPDEDKGKEKGGRQTVDVVALFKDGRPAFATQITTNDSKDMMIKKLQEMRDNPFIRLDDMRTQDVSIPKVLVVLDPKQVKSFFEDPLIRKHPELMLKVIEDHIRSFTYDLSQTKHPPQQEAVRELIRIFTEEKKKYTH